MIDELEQARVALEDSDRRVTELAAANEVLSAQLRDERRRRVEAEQHLAKLREEHSAAVSAKDARLDQLHEQLTMALEELSVMSEELRAAKDILERQNASHAGYTSPH